MTENICNLLPHSLIAHNEADTMFNPAFCARLFDDRLIVQPWDGCVYLRDRQHPLLAPNVPWVIIEGADGSGKSSISAATEALMVAEQIDTTRIPLPGGTPTGLALRKMVLDRSLAIPAYLAVRLMAVNIMNVMDEVMVPKWKAITKHLVITDRWPTISGFVYQADHFVDDVPSLEMLERLSRAYGPLIAPTVFYVRVSLETSLRRRPVNPENPFEHSVDLRAQQLARYERVMSMLHEHEICEVVVIDNDVDSADGISKAAKRVVDSARCLANTYS